MMEPRPAALHGGCLTNELEMLTSTSLLTCSPAAFVFREPLTSRSSMKPCEQEGVTPSLQNTGTRALSTRTC